ncbi:MAG: hypothetical protein FWE67_13950 [Planctomycetaceae bacterium]|nr:hypothetical protein [Planctomycetaceae bacterium]
MITKRLIFVLLIFVFTVRNVLAQQQSETQRLTARIQKMMDEVPDGGPTGEQVGWNWNWHISQLMDKCKQTPTDELLLPTEKILNTMFNKMSEGPDGYYGFVGPYIYNNEYWCDVHVSDAILTGHALTFAMLIHDKPELKKKYKTSYDRFIAVAKTNLIEKWDKRNTYFEDGPFAGYSEGTMFCKPNDMKNWFEKASARPNDAPAPTLPFNKDLDMAYCMLQLYYLTGEVYYKNCAEKIFNRCKAGMNRFNGGYTWNYWEPTSPKDIIEKAPGRWDLSHWVGTHPYRDYQLSEVSKIIFAYDFGVTFTEEDIKRLVHTNLKFMWNGKVGEDAQWANSDSKLPGYVKAKPSTAYPTTAGTVWSPLARFDETIGKLSKKPQPVNWARKYVQDEDNARRLIQLEAQTGINYYWKMPVRVEDFPWMKGIAESGGQTLAAVIPSVVPAGESTMIISKSYNVERSPLEIYVRPLGEPPTASAHLTTQQMGNSVLMYYSWDGTINGVRKPGEYVIIWKFLGGERAYPVTLR